MTAPNDVHELKTWPEPFAAIELGLKSYEIRVNDRDFKVGDDLRLREWAPQEEWRGGHRMMPERGYDGYTGREVTVRVTYMTPGGAWGLPKNLCVMSISVLP